MYYSTYIRLTLHRNHIIWLIGFMQKKRLSSSKAIIIKRYNYVIYHFFRNETKKWQVRTSLLDDRQGGDFLCVDKYIQNICSSITIKWQSQYAVLKISKSPERF